jgi:hypothetical protein
MLRDAGQLLGDAHWWQNEIDASLHDGAMWHARESCRTLILDECNASLLLDLCQAQCPIGSGAREDDADGPTSVLLGQRSKEIIDRHVEPAGLAAGRKPECHVIHGHVGVGR